MGKKASFPFFSILALVFITLKLAGIGVVATWSWWWVLSPIWLPITVVLGIILVLTLITAIITK
jgi:hypothetical protein